MSLSILRSETFDTTACYRCGTVVVMSAEMMRKRIEDKEPWFCINGHQQHFTGKSEADKLREQLAAAQKDLAERRDAINQKDRAIAALKGAAKRTKTRLANGVCPCCNRTFQNLGRHMGTKHPDYKTQDIG